ncbi:D-2-hydroxyacid dehydrogenase [Streptomyces sp. TRM66268-LWL]|uniref:D-2-hydroxyacid dehydrogenase n=1 Tax=Streptomyces polyasparticus TaxID=2767826 RepID=A0ABR7ST20_9ACTN|nr:D-2-hydroxyacid dehydrogenase [Streptomyces polyasparticus]MBC9717820.1 D-2-hydroxyacid dehydrogenase [Streptomyces polyasparticus]
MTTVMISLNSPYDFWQFGEWHLKLLVADFPEVTFELVADVDAPGRVPEADVYFGWSFSAEWLAQASRLRWVASPAAGVDHLPVDRLMEARVGLTRGYGYHGRPMAEHALGLLLGFSRGLFLSQRLQARAPWWKDQLADAFFDLHGQTLTIVGCGSVGTQLAIAAQALGMHVIGVRRQAHRTDGIGIEWKPASRVDEALARSKVVVNLLPATTETTGFFSATTFDACQRGAVFLNLGRASTVDHTALIAALDSGRLSGAGLDVHPTKPPAPDDPLRRHPRVVLTPKTATFSRTYMDRAVAFFHDNLHLYLADRPLNGTVVPLPDGGTHAR